MISRALVTSQSHAGSMIAAGFSFVPPTPRAMQQPAPRPVQVLLGIAWRDLVAIYAQRRCRRVTGLLLGNHQFRTSPLSMWSYVRGSPLSGYHHILTSPLLAPEHTCASSLSVYNCVRTSLLSGHRPTRTSPTSVRGPIFVHGAVHSSLVVRRLPPHLHAAFVKALPRSQITHLYRRIGPEQRLCRATTPPAHHLCRVASTLARRLCRATTTPARRFCRETTPPTRGLDRHATTALFLARSALRPLSAQCGPRLVRPPVKPAPLLVHLGNKE